MSEHSDMGCGEFADVAAELALGVLMGRERAGALAHLERCDACRETVRQLTMTGEQLLELLPAVEPPAGFESRTMARLGIAVPDVPPPGHARTAGPYHARELAAGRSPRWRPRWPWSRRPWAAGPRTTSPPPRGSPP